MIFKYLENLNYSLGLKRSLLEETYEANRTRVELYLWLQRTILLLIELPLALKSLVLRLSGKDGRRKYIVCRYDGFGNLLEQCTRFEKSYDNNDTQFHRLKLC